jgi:Uma2 family endonuclease
MSPIGPLHGGVVKSLISVFNPFPQGRWLLSVQGPVHLENHSEPQPDFMLVKPVVDNYRSRHPKPEDVFLLVEVSDSTLDTDLEVKLPVYARAGIEEVWIVNMDDRRLEVYREPHFDSYATTQLLHEGDKVAPAHFQDAVIEVAELSRR